MGESPFNGGIGMSRDNYSSLRFSGSFSDTICIMGCKLLEEGVNNGLIEKEFAEYHNCCKNTAYCRNIGCKEN